MRFSVICFTLFGTLSLLTGCAATTDNIVQNVSSSSIEGTVFGGQQPVTGSTITVWQMGTSGYGAGATQLASVTTDMNGNFLFASNAYTCAYNNAPVYITAQGGNPGAGANANLMLAAGIGACSSAHTVTVNIDEVTTVATAFALGQFFTTTLGGAPTTDFFGGTAAGSGTYNVGLVAANSNTIPTLVNLASGQANGSSATITIESAKINSIANTLAACVNSTGQTNATETTTACGKLFNYTKPAGTRPADTLQAAVQMSVYPYRNVSNLYNLATGSAPFGGLSVAPNDWTVAVSYTIPTFGLGINGNGGLQTSSNIDIDAAGKVWFPTNSAAAQGVAFFDPASGTFNGPYSTALGHSQYVAIDGVGNIWSTDLASATVVSNSTTSPATTGTSYTATSSAAGGPVVVASDNTVLFAYTTTGGLHNVGQISSNAFSVNYANEFTGTPTGLASAGAHYAFAATESTSQGCEEEILGTPQSQSGGSCSSGGIAATTQGNDFLLTATSLNKVADNNEDDYFTPPVPVSGPEGVAIDGKGNLWIANSGNASVSTFSYINNNFDDSDYHQTSPIAYLHDSTHGNTLTTPFGIAIDRSGNVWVSNAGCVSTSSTCLATNFVLTELVGAGGPTITPLAAQQLTYTGTPPASVAYPAHPTSAQVHH